MLRDDRLIVGFEGADDAGVVRLEDGRYLIQTLDFFTPIVDDPYTFGAIAAANSLSDVYAMGGRPISVMNILCWPDGDLPEEVLAAIMQGGADKVREAGALLVGGHSVKDPQLKYGLSVTGEVAPDGLWTNAGAKPGDVLVLSKPLGSGIVSTALKRELCDEALVDRVADGMATLNRAAAEAAAGLGVNACTDITGFGLVGHGWEMARGSSVRLVITASKVPVFDGVVALAEAGCVNRGDTLNRAYVGDALSWGDVRPGLQSAIVDPQTSGGLLFSLPPAAAAQLIDAGVGTLVGRVEAADSPGVHVEG